MFSKKKKTKPEVEKFVNINIYDKEGNILEDQEYEYVFNDDPKEIVISDEKLDKTKMSKMGFMNDEYMKKLQDMFPDMDDETLGKTVMDACMSYKTNIDSKSSEMLSDEEKTNQSLIIKKLVSKESEKARMDKMKQDLLDSVEKAKQDFKESDEIATEDFYQEKYDELRKSGKE